MILQLQYEAMPNTPDWGEAKESYTLRITPTAKEGLKELAESIGSNPNDLIERLGRGAREEVMKQTLWGVLTMTIMQLHNEKDRRNPKGD